MESSKMLAVLVAVSLIIAANAANILCLMGAATESNQMRSHELFKALAARGHKLTVVGDAEFVRKFYGKNGTKGPDGNIIYRHLNVPSSKMPSEYDQLERIGSYEKLLLWNERQWNICHEMLSSKVFYSIVKWGIRKTRAFDLIIYDIIHAPDCLLSLANVFDKESPMAKEVPMVAMNLDAKVIQEMFEVAHGGGINYSKVPFFLSHFNDDMGIGERFYNMCLYGYAYFTRYLTLGNDIYEMTVQHSYLLQSNITFDYNSIMKRVKIVLVNSHPLLNFHQPLPPNIIEVAGWQITHPKGLPQNVLDHCVRKSNSGIVFMSFGHSFQIDNLAERNRVRSILSVIIRFPEFVFLWKVENGASITNRPANLFMSKYLSENDVLAHPKTKVFVTVAEIMNLQEAIHYGVPMIVIPLLIDHLNLARRMHDRKCGLVLHFETAFFSEEKLHKLLTLIFDNYSEFKKTAERLQFNFRNRPQPPLDTVIWWVEALLANPGGFDHLVGPKPYNFLIANSLDVFLPLTMYFSCVLLLNVLLWRYCVWKNIVAAMFWGYENVACVFINEAADDLNHPEPEPQDMEPDLEEMAYEPEDMPLEPEDVPLEPEDMPLEPEEMLLEQEEMPLEPEAMEHESEDMGCPNAKNVNAQPQSAERVQHKKKKGKKGKKGKKRK